MVSSRYTTKQQSTGHIHSVQELYSGPTPPKHPPLPKPLVLPNPALAHNKRAKNTRMDHRREANSWTTVTGPYTGPSLAEIRLMLDRPATPPASGASLILCLPRIGICSVSSSSRCLAATSRAATVDAIVVLLTYSVFCTGPSLPEAHRLAELACVLASPWSISTRLHPERSATRPTSDAQAGGGSAHAA